MSSPLVMAALLASTVSCVVEIPQDGGDGGQSERFSAPVTENPSPSSLPPGHGRPKGPGGTGPPGQDKGKGK